MSKATVGNRAARIDAMVDATAKSMVRTARERKQTSIPWEEWKRRYYRWATAADMQVRLEDAGFTECDERGYTIAPPPGTAAYLTYSRIWEEEMVRWEEERRALFHDCTYYFPEPEQQARRGEGTRRSPKQEEGGGADNKILAALRANPGVSKSALADAVAPKGTPGRRGVEKRINLLVDDRAIGYEPPTTPGGAGRCWPVGIDTAALIE